MARATVVENGLTYTINFDDPRVVGRAFQSLAVGQLIDEITNQPISSPVTVTTDLVGATVKTAEDGIAGLVGIPLRVFPQLDTSTYSYQLGFQVQGYTPWTAEIDLAVQPGFPAAFTDVDLGQVAMRRTPFVLKGRTVTLNASNVPVGCAGATVAVTGLWRLTQDIDVIAGPPVVPFAGTDPGIYAGRPVGSTLEIVALPPVVEPPRSLLDDAAVGATRVTVSQSVGLTPGNVVGFDIADPDRVEYIEIAQIFAANDPNSPADLVLRFPLKRRHKVGALVQKVTVPAAGAPAAILAATAEPGDATIFLSTVAALGASQLTRIAGGASVPEYTQSLLYEATADSDGFYRLPAMTRVAAFEVTATRSVPLPALHSPATLFTPDYALYENRLDLTLS